MPLLYLFLISKRYHFFANIIYYEKIKIKYFVCIFDVYLYI